MDVREKHQLVATHTHPNQEPNPQPRHVPQLGIKPVAFHFAESHRSGYSLLNVGEMVFVPHLILSSLTVVL